MTIKSQLFKRALQQIAVTVEIADDEIAPLRIGWDTLTTLNFERLGHAVASVLRRCDHSVTPHGVRTQTNSLHSLTTEKET